MNLLCGLSATPRVHLLRPTEALQLDVAALVERELACRLSRRLEQSRHQNLVALGCTTNARREVDVRPEEVVCLLDALAGVEIDADAGSSASTFRSAKTRCIPMAQRSPSMAERKASMKLSSIDFTSYPLWAMSWSRALSLGDAREYRGTGGATL